MTCPWCKKQEASWTSLSKQSEDELLERARAFNRITSPKPKEDDSRHAEERSKVRKPRPPILARSPSHDHIHVVFRLARLNSCSFFVRWSACGWQVGSSKDPPQAGPFLSRPTRSRPNEIGWLPNRDIPLAHTDPISRNGSGEGPPMIEYRVIVPEAKIEILGQTDCHENSAPLTRKNRENEGISRGSSRWKIVILGDSPVLLWSICSYLWLLKLYLEIFLFYLRDT